MRASRLAPSRPRSASTCAPEPCRAEGDLDFRGTLAVAREAPVGFRSIRLAFELETEATDEELETLLKLTERYCVVYQTLASRPRATSCRDREERLGARTARPARAALCES